MSIYTLGIDIGSTASKCIMLSDGKEIVAKSLISVGAGTSGPQRPSTRCFRRPARPGRRWPLSWPPAMAATLWRSSPTAR